MDLMIWLSYFPDDYKVSLVVRLKNQDVGTSLALMIKSCDLRAFWWEVHRFMNAKHFGT